MRDSNSGGRGFSRDNSRFKGRSDGFRPRRDDREARPMFKATCAQCNKPCEVPFRPSGNKPVLCSYCFEEQKGAGDGGSRPERRSDRPSYSKDVPFRSSDSSQALKDIALKLDKIINLLAAPKSRSEAVIIDDGELKIEKPSKKKELKEEKPKAKPEEKAKEKKVAKPKTKKVVAKKETKKKKK